MKRQSLVLLAVAFVAAGAVGCFSDPVTSLQKTPALLSLDHQSVFLNTGDSVVVVATLKDKFGDALPATGASWTSGDQTIAVVRMDTTVVPGNYFSRAFIRGVTTTGNWTTVIVTSRGVADTIRVTVFPAGVDPALVTASGTATTDTAVIPAQAGPPPVAAQNVIFSAKDTLLLAGTSVLNFDTSKVTVAIVGKTGTATGYIIAKTPTALKVVFNTGATGNVIIHNLLLNTANPAVGTLPIDSLVGPSDTISRQRFRGAVSQVGDTMTFTAGANEAFTSSTGAAFGTKAAIVLSQTATSLSVLSPVTYTGQVTVTNVTMGTAVVPSMTTNAGAPYSINAATFPLANVTMSPNNARLGDTVILTAPTGLSFVTSGSASKLSNVLLGNTAITTSDTAWILSATASTMKVFARRGGNLALSVTNLKLGSGAVIPALATPSAVAIDSINTDFLPATTKATAHVTTITAGTPDTVYGAVNCSATGCQQAPFGTTTNDYWTFTTTASQVIGGTIYWFGSGNPYSTGTNTTAYTADLDMVLCNATQACPISEANDLWGGKAASTAMPETAATAAAQAAGQYWVNVIPFTGPFTVVYRLIITLQ